MNNGLEKVKDIRLQSVQSMEHYNDLCCFASEIEYICVYVLHGDLVMKREFLAIVTIVGVANAKHHGLLH